MYDDDVIFLYHQMPLQSSNRAVFHWTTEAALLGASLSKNRSLKVFIQFKGLSQCFDPSSAVSTWALVELQV